MEEVFQILVHADQWWSGLYQESISGKVEKINDEFVFKAGNGAHYSKQKLVEFEPNQKLTWLVTDSKLVFLAEPGEWTGTKINFTLTKQNNKTTVTFTHEGLVPEIECYDACSTAWTKYLENLKEKLK